MEGGKGFAEYWILEYCCRRLCESFVESEKSDGLDEEMQRHFDIITGILPQAAVESSRTQTIWLLLAELCVRIKQEKFEFEAGGELFESISGCFRFLGDEFPMFTEQFDHLSRTFDKIFEIKAKQLRSKTLKTKVDKEYATFINSVKGLVQKVIDKIVSPFLHQISSLNESSSCASGLSESEMLDLLDMFLKDLRDGDLENENPKERAEDNDAAAEPTKKSTRRLYNPKNNVLQPNHETSPSGSAKKRQPPASSTRRNRYQLRSSPKKDQSSASKAWKRSARGTVLNVDESLTYLDQEDDDVDLAAREDVPSESSSDDVNTLHKTRSKVRHGINSSDSDGTDMDSAGGDDVVIDDGDGGVVDDDGSGVGGVAGEDDKGDDDVDDGDDDDDDDGDDVVSDTLELISTTPERSRIPEDGGSSHRKVRSKTGSRSREPYEMRNATNVDQDMEQEEEESDDDFFMPKKGGKASRDLSSAFSFESNETSEQDRNESAARPSPRNKRQSNSGKKQGHVSASKNKGSLSGRNRRSGTTRDESNEDDSLDDDSILLEGNTIANTKKVAKRRPFSLEEEDYLRAGVRKHGVGKWAKILQSYPFNSRTSVNLKDKWRNLVRNGST